MVTKISLVVDCEEGDREQQGMITKNLQETFGGDSCVYYLDCSGGTWVYKMYQIEQFKYIHFVVCQLFFTEGVNK